jgi:hypothetical protein
MRVSQIESAMTMALPDGLKVDVDVDWLMLMLMLKRSGE